MRRIIVSIINKENHWLIKSVKRSILNREVKTTETHILYKYAYYNKGMKSVVYKVVKNPFGAEEVTTERSWFTKKRILREIKNYLKQI